jgi:hypothetical protein
MNIKICEGVEVAKLTFSTGVHHFTLFVTYLWHVKHFLSGHTNVLIIYVAFFVRNKAYIFIYVILLSLTLYLSKSHSESVITLSFCRSNRWATSGVVPCYLCWHPAMFQIHSDKSPVVTKPLLINFVNLL